MLRAIALCEAFQPTPPIFTPLRLPLHLRLRLLLHLHLQIHLEVADSKKNGGGAVVAEAVPMGAPATTVNDSEVSPNANKIVRN